MEIGSLSSIVSVALAMLLALFGAFRYVTAQGEALRREIGSASEKATLLVDKLSESEGKRRHDLANQMQSTYAKLEVDMRSLQRDAVTQQQINALEARVGTTLSKIEQKVDRLGETSAEIAAMRITLQTLAQQIDRMSRRLDKEGKDGV